MLNARRNPFASVLAASALMIMAGGIPALASQVDHRIEAAARNSYNFRVILHDDGIKIDSNNGMVTLSGNVGVDFHRALAEQTVSDLPGVRGVDNQLVIAGAQPVAASDDWITMKVKSTFAFHKNVSALDTDVHTSGGIVTLTGRANTGAERDLAGEYAKDVDGVMEVHNDIAVGPGSGHHHETVGEKIDDSSITAQIKTTLLFHKSVRTLSTKVITKDGVVSLHGQARTEAEKEKVTRLAEDIKGVRHVNNHMTVASL